METKRRKVDDECRVFKEEWGFKYFFVQSLSKNGKAICVICNDTVAVMKEYNLRRHYETQHASAYSQFKDKQRTEKFEKMSRSLSCQQNLFRKANSENESLTLVSTKVAYLLAKKGKPFMDGNIVKECMMEAVGVLCPEKVKLFKSISLSRNTVARRIDDIGNNILHQISGKAQRFTHYSIAMDESTDISDTSQLLVFVRGVDDDLNVTQELASVNSMHGTTTGADIFKELQQTLTKYNLDWNRLQGVTIDGGRNMSGANIGVVGLIRKACESAGATVPIFLHCIIHQQALCVKHVDMSCVLKPVVSVVNFIRSRALNHRQFRSFLEEIESESVDLSYYTAVRWLSCGKVLLQFFKLRKEIKIFLAEKNHPEPLLSDAEWLWKLAIFADVVTHVNNLNLKLQGKNNLICDLFEQIKAFRAKLILLESHMNECNFSHFTCCEKFSTETDERFPTIFAVKVIADLKLEFQKRFSDLDINSREIRLFQNPYDCNVGDVSSQFQMEIIDLQASDQIKNKYKEGNLIDFYKFLDAKEFPNLKQLAGKFISMYGTTYMCEQTFSRMKYLKSKYRANLSDDHLQSLLIIGVSDLNPNFEEILQEKTQFHHSH